MKNLKAIRNNITKPGGTGDSIRPTHGESKQPGFLMAFSFLSSSLPSLIETLNVAVYELGNGSIFSAEKQLKSAVLADMAIFGEYGPKDLAFIIDRFFQTYSNCEHKDPILDRAEHYINAQVAKGEWNHRLPKMADCMINIIATKGDRLPNYSPSQIGIMKNEEIKNNDQENETTEKPVIDWDLQEEMESMQMDNEQDECHQGYMHYLRGF